MFQGAYFHTRLSYVQSQHIKAIRILNAKDRFPDEAFIIAIAMFTPHRTIGSFPLALNLLQDIVVALVE